MKYFSLLLLTGSVCFGQCTNPDSGNICGPKTSANGNWKILNMAADNGSGDIGCYSQNQVAFNPNALTITMIKGSGYTCSQTNHSQASQPYLSGAVVSNFTFARSPSSGATYTASSGTISIYVKGQMGRGWPAVWLLGHNCDPATVGSWDNVGTCNWSSDSSDSEEVDIEENYESGGYTSPGHNMFINNGSVACGGPSVSDVTKSVHTYSMSWSGTLVDMKVDGNDANCGYKSNLPTQPVNLIIENRVNPSGAPPSSAFPTTQTIQYVQICNGATCTNPGSPVPGDNTLFFDNFGNGSQGVSVSGAVTSSGSGLSGVTVQLSNSSVNTSTTTTSTGSYQFNNVANGTYTLSSSSTKYTFNPTSLQVTVAGGSLTNENFTATAVRSQMYSIGGTVTYSQGANLALAGPVSGNTSTDSNGNYNFNGLPDGSYMVTPSQSGATFSPSNHSVTVSSGNVSGVDFTGTTMQQQGSIAIDTKVSTAQNSASTTVTSPTFSTKGNSDVLVAFVAADAPSAGQYVQSLSGAGLSWTLASRTNTQMGDAEIWIAKTVASLTSVTVTATLQQSAVSSITVIAFSGARGIGATGTANSKKGAPAVSLTTTANNSWVFAIGDDYDNAIARTLGANQTLQYQDLSSSGDTYWVQSTSSTTPTAGTVVNLNDTAPTTDRYNFSAVEVLAQ